MAGNRRTILFLELSVDLLHPFDGSGRLAIRKHAQHYRNIDLALDFMGLGISNPDHRPRRLLARRLVDGFRSGKLHWLFLDQVLHLQVPHQHRCHREDQHQRHAQPHRLVIDFGVFL